MSKRKTPKPPPPDPWEVDDDQLPPLRNCQGCGAQEKRNALGFSTIAFHLGYCVDCINRAAGGLK